MPYGSFVLSLPGGYPLCEWDVQALRVCARPEGLWIAVVAGGGQAGVSFGWRPGESLSRWVVSEQAEPLLQATLAALWRDLVVAGETAVPARGKASQSRGAGEGEQPRRSRRRGSSGRALPRVRFSGKRTWGSRREHEAIRRRAHGVRGHLRRLQPDWRPSPEARGQAEEYGIVLPEGATFVSPHVRGGGSEREKVEPPAEVVVQARGLASVMVLLGRDG